MNCRNGSACRYFHTNEQAQSQTLTHLLPLEGLVSPPASSGSVTPPYRTPPGLSPPSSPRHSYVSSSPRQSVSSMNTMAVLASLYEVQRARASVQSENDARQKEYSSLPTKHSCFLPLDASDHGSPFPVRYSCFYPLNVDEV